MSTGDALDPRALDRRIRIERQVSAATELGGESISYTLRASVWAQVIHVRGREALLAQQVQPGVDIEFRIRWRDDVQLTDRIVYKGQHYDVQHLAEMGRQRRLRIQAKLPGAEAT